MPCGELGGALVSLPKEWSSRRLLHPLPEGKGRQVSGCGTSAEMVSLGQVVYVADGKGDWSSPYMPRECWAGVRHAVEQSCCVLGRRGRQPWSLKGLTHVPPGLLTTGPCLKFNGVFKAVNNPCCFLGSSGGALAPAPFDPAQSPCSSLLALPGLGFLCPCWQVELQPVVTGGLRCPRCGEAAVTQMGHPGAVGSSQRS